MSSLRIAKPDQGLQRQRRREKEVLDAITSGHCGEKARELQKALAATEEEFSVAVANREPKSRKTAIKKTIADLRLKLDAAMETDASSELWEAFRAITARAKPLRTIPLVQTFVSLPPLRTKISSAGNTPTGQGRSPMVSGGLPSLGKRR